MPFFNREFFTRRFGDIISNGMSFGGDVFFDNLTYYSGNSITVGNITHSVNQSLTDGYLLLITQHRYPANTGFAPTGSFNGVEANLFFDYESSAVCTSMFYLPLGNISNGTYPVTVGIPTGTFNNNTFRYSAITFGNVNQASGIGPILSGATFNSTYNLNISTNTGGMAFANFLHQGGTIFSGNFTGMGSNQFLILESGTQSLSIKESDGTTTNMSMILSGSASTNINRIGFGLNKSL